MDINFADRIDEREEIVELYNGNGFNFQLFLQDDEYGELISRTSFGNEYNDMDYLINETDITVDATANLYEDKVVSVTIVVQDDLNGWKDDEIMISGEEAVSLLQDMKKAAVKEGFDELVNLIDKALSDRTAQTEQKETDIKEFYPEKLYNLYKENWKAEHIDDVTMTQTEALYENSEESKEMSFDEYVAEFGFADGSCYACFGEFCEEELHAYELADKIEQYMYERGEYDFPEDDTIRWIEKDSREATAVNIVRAIEEDIFSLDNYFDDELAELDDNDELFATALEIRDNLKEIIEKRYDIVLEDRPVNEQKKSDMERE